MSTNVVQKSEIIEVIQQCVKLGYEINIPYRNDPPLFYKALVIRELKTTQTFLINSKTDLKMLILNQSEWLVRFFSILFEIPSQPVPIAKLLLHANTIVKKKKTEDTSFGINEIKKLLISASLGFQSKPTFKVKDFIEFSPAYNDLLSKLGTQNGHNLKLIDIIQSMDEVSNTLFKTITNFILEDIIRNTKNINILFSFLNILSYQDPTNNNRNSFHSLLTTGSSIMLNEFSLLLTNTRDIIHNNNVEFNNNNKDKEEFDIKVKNILKQALLTSFDTRVTHQFHIH
jgi:hypothetical protein